LIAFLIGSSLVRLDLLILLDVDCCDGTVQKTVVIDGIDQLTVEQ
jgi:hypothetical protein